MNNTGLKLIPWDELNAQVEAERKNNPYNQIGFKEDRWTVRKDGTIHPHKSVREHYFVHSIPDQVEAFDWLAHLLGKTWMTPTMFRNLVAIFKEMNLPQYKRKEVSNG